MSHGSAVIRADTGWRQDVSPVPPTKQPWLRSWPAWPLVLFAYGLLGLAAYWPVLPGQSSRIPFCACSDPALEVWFLRWVPFALSHAHNPFFTNWANYPSGINLAQNTGMPLLGLLTAPLTVLVGPLASYNLLLWLAFPLSAASMYFVLKRWTFSVSAAFVGGLVYGFSAYMVGQGQNHVMLSFVPLPPLLFFQSHKVIVASTARDAYIHGSFLGLLVAAQFLIEPEVLASTALLASIAVVTLVIFRWRSVSKLQVACAFRGILCSGAVASVIIGYPVWMMEFGPHRYSGSPWPLSNPYRTDLLGGIVPGPLQLIAPFGLRSLGVQITGGNPGEYGAYLGLPLLAIVAGLTIRFRHNLWMVFAFAMSAIAFALSLGPRLVVAGHRTPIPGPFRLVALVPLLSRLLPSRLALMEMFFISVALSIGTAEWLRSTRTARLRGGLHRQTRLPGPLAPNRIALLLVTLVPLIPAWPYRSVPAGVPGFFSSGAAGLVPANSVVLTYPYPIYPGNQAMMWQAVAGMRFKMVGGYALLPDSHGSAELYPDVLWPPIVQAFLVYQDWHGGYLTSRPDLNQTIVDSTRLFLERYHVSTVIAAPEGLSPNVAVNLFSESLGPSRVIGGVRVWLNVPARLTQLSHR